MDKYYRVIKVTPGWKEGAILKENNTGHYEPIEDIWDTVPIKTGDTYEESSRIVENRPEFFERIYKDNLKGNIFRTADQLKERYKEAFKK